MTRRNAASISTLALGLTLGSALNLACSPSPPAGPTRACETCDETATYELCAAIRGNGQLITAHFAAMARITEHYGLIDGSAGGSSASITQFFAESIKMNPLVYQCGDEPCTEAQVRARAGLLFKSFPGYMMALQGSSEGIAIAELAPVVARIRAEGIESMLETDPDAAAEALRTILSSPEIRDLINPEILELLQSSPNPEFHVRDVLAGIEKLTAFDTQDVHIFLRPGLIDFESMAEKLGRAASLYAGYAPADPARMGAFLDGCAESGAEKSWFEVMHQPLGDSTCGQAFAALVTDFRTRLLADESSYASRIDDPIGTHLAALVSTSVLVGDGAQAFAAARAAYLAGEPVDSLGVSWDDVRFGYWGAEADLERVAANPRGYDDPKTRKFLSLGTASWREALTYSPAEPGLSRALELGSERVSAGGWSDLHPVLALKNMGCDKVIYVTRTGEESGFTLGVVPWLGLPVEHSGNLYDLDEPISSYAMSVSEADAVWCTNWNDIPAADVVSVTVDAYRADMESRDAYFSDGPNAYPRSSSDLGRRGCSID